jgi:2-polyprenyl-3-methyl-5-hydroxy-6-metoxy-1,4-benzoquinol methylase
VLFKEAGTTASSFTILDVGAGPGTLSEYLVREPAIGTVFNVEIGSKMKVENLIVADGSRLPFIDNSFDATISTDVLEHVEFDRRADFIRELLRCSKFGFVITFSKLHKRNTLQGGIKIFEKVWGVGYPLWYVEHNEQKIVDTAALTKLLMEYDVRNAELKPLTGVFTLFFTGLECRLSNRWLRFLSNVTGYLLTRIIDPLPYYGFGATALKRRM